MRDVPVLDSSPLRRGVGSLVALSLIVVAIACLPSGVSGPAVLSQLLEARRLASELHVEFTKAADAANRAVMADTDQASVAAASVHGDAMRRFEITSFRSKGDSQPMAR